MKLLRWATLLWALVVSGCGGGGSTSDVAPVASNLRLLPGDTGTYVLEFSRSSEVATIRTTVYDSKGARVRTTDIPLSQVTEESTPVTQAHLDFTTLPYGDYTVDICYTDRKGRQSNKLTKSFHVEEGFRLGRFYEGFSNLGATAIGDLNGDGRNDVVSIEALPFYSSGRMLIYYQNSSGTLDKAKMVDLDFKARGVAIADVNGDGKADLVVSGIKGPGQENLARLAVYLQDPNTGELQAPKQYDVASAYPGTLAVADVDGDGRNDIVVFTPMVGFSIFFQKSDGTLGPEFVYANLDWGGVMIDGEIHVGDVTGDGRNDIVLQSGRTELAVIRQTAPRVFSPVPERYAVQATPWQFYTFALGDVNGDGRTDIVALDATTSGYLNVFTQNSQGTLDRSLVPNPDDAFGILIADINGDGLNDIVLDVMGGLLVLPQQSDHQIGAKLFYSYRNPGYNPTGWTVTHSGKPQALSFGDVTGDGRLDMVSTRDDEGLYVFPGVAQLSQK